MCGLGLHRDGAPLDPRSASGGRFRAEVDALYRRWASDGLLALDTRWRAARAVVADHNGAPGAELDAALSAEAQARAALDQAVLAACQPRKCARPSPSPSPAPAAGGCRPSPSPTPRGRGWPATHGWCDCVACLAAPGPRTGAPPACPGERRVCGVCFCGCRRASVLPGSHAVDPPVGRSPAAVRDGIKKKRQDLVALHPEDGHRRIHCDPARPPPPPGRGRPWAVRSGWATGREPDFQEVALFALWFEAKFPDLWVGEPTVPEKQQAEWDAVMVSPSRLFFFVRLGGGAAGHLGKAWIRSSAVTPLLQRGRISEPPALPLNTQQDRGSEWDAPLHGVCSPTSHPALPTVRIRVRGWARYGARPVPRPQGLPASRTPLEPPCPGGDDDGLFPDEEDPTDPDWGAER
jgi:hypothetical protein